MPSQETAVPRSSALDYESVAPDEDWAQEPEALPRRPRRRLLAPIPLSLIAVLLLACGFVAGVEVQKGQMSSSSGTGAGFASRLAALGGGLPGGGPTGRATGVSGARAGAGASAGGNGAGGAGVTSGEVSYIRGSTIYVTNSQGNTIKVSASAGSKVTKTVTTKANSIHPGDTVVVLGSQAKNGAVTATSISVGSTGLGGSIGSGGSSGTGGGGPALFGSG